MKLFLIHCGFYDQGFCDGIYEFHLNFFVAAKDFEDAKHRAREIPEFKLKKMHVDGVQEVQAVQGYQVRLEEVLELEGATVIISNRHRDLAPKKTRIAKVRATLRIDDPEQLHYHEVQSSF